MLFDLDAIYVQSEGNILYLYL